MNLQKMVIFSNNNLQQYKFNKRNVRHFSKTNSFIGGISKISASTIDNISNKQKNNMYNHVIDENIRKRIDFSLKIKKIIDEYAIKNKISNYHIEYSKELETTKLTIYFTNTN